RRKNRASSMNSKWMILGDVGAIEIAKITLVFVTLITSKDNTFDTMINKYGEMGSPYLKPRVGSISPLFCPFTWKEYETIVTSCIIHLSHFSLNFIASMTSSKKPHSTLLYALFILSFEYCQISTSSSQTPHMVENIMCHKNFILNKLAWYEGCLIWKNYSLK